MSKKTGLIILHKSTKRLVDAQKALRKYYNQFYEKDSKGINFTLDGKLVGDIGEALAVEYYGMELADSGNEGYDGLIKNKKIEVKATGRENGSALFRKTKVKADYVLFFKLNYEKLTVDVIFNGPANEIYRKLKGIDLGKQKSITMNTMKQFHNEINESKRLKRIK